MKNRSGVAHTVVAARENVVPGGRSIRLDCSVNGGYLSPQIPPQKLQLCQLLRHCQHPLWNNSVSTNFVRGDGFDELDQEIMAVWEFAMFLFVSVQNNCWVSPTQSKGVHRHQLLWPRGVQKRSHM